MFKYNVLIKSGTSGHYDYDNCDLVVKSNFKSSIPLSAGDIITIRGKRDNISNTRNRSYVVSEIIVSEDCNECYVLRVYDGEEKVYIRAFDHFADIIANDSGIKNKTLINFAKEWEMAREK